MLSGYYQAFLDAVVGSDPKMLGAYLEDRALVSNALVYRNTMFRGAADALATAYPAVARLAGDAYFEHVAIAYVESSPPRRRSMVGYGEGLADFLETAPGIEEAPYLADAARLDCAWLAAHRAPSQVPLAAADLAALRPEGLADLVLKLHPSVRLLKLGWSIHDAWKHNRTDAPAIAQHVLPERQHVMLWRPAHEVETQVLSAPEALFFTTLAAGASLGEAAETALAAAPDFNTTLVFAGALEAGVFASEQIDLDTKREEWW
jgi:hypothetical protein